MFSWKFNGVFRVQQRVRFSEIPNGVRDLYQTENSKVQAARGLGTILAIGIPR
jgi:hypothetical protein